jgi:hypothetical protein
MTPTPPPSAWTLQKVVSDAMRTLETLRTEHGVILDSGDDVLAALAEENVPVERLLRLLVARFLDDKSNGIAADLRIADLRQRRERFKRAEETMRAIAQQVMEAVGLKSAPLVEATLSLSAGNPKVIITDADKLPDNLVKIETIRTPDKAAIKTALDDRRALIDAARAQGEEPPPELEGAELSNGGSVLTVRTR